MSCSRLVAPAGVLVCGIHHPEAVYILELESVHIYKSLFHIPPQNMKIRILDMYIIHTHGTARRAVWCCAAMV